jgi:hypothetical protein
MVPSTVSQTTETLKEVRIVDGGFIHNIPVAAANAWGPMTHIILIEASPAQHPGEPRDFWDNAMTAFGYLFTAAQRTDKLAKGKAETFDLRPTSPCEKQNVKPFCTDDHEDGLPIPNMDTFDFAPDLISKAFNQGINDVDGDVPLFMRVPGQPQLRTVAATAIPGDSSTSVK